MVRDVLVHDVGLSVQEAFAGATSDEVRELAHSGAEFYLERPVEAEDRLPRSLGEADESS